MSGRKIVEETDVYLSLPKSKTYSLHYFTQPRGRDMNEETELVAVRRKPLQQKIELEYQVRPHMQGVRNEEGDTHSIKMQSESVNLRGTQLLLQKVGDKVYAVPIEKVMAMRNYVEKPKGELTNIDSKKATKGEIVKQIESRLRTYQFQQEVLGGEEWAQYRIVKSKNAGIETGKQ